MEDERKKQIVTAMYDWCRDLGVETHAIEGFYEREIKPLIIEVYDEGYEAGENAKPPSIRDAVAFRQEQYGWTDGKMAAMLDLTRSHYSEFKNGKRGLPIGAIRKAYAIGVPASVLLAEQETIKRKGARNVTSD